MLALVFVAVVFASLFVVAVAGVLVAGVPAMGRFPGGGVRDSCLLAEKPVFVAVRGLALLALVAACVSGAIVRLISEGSLLAWWLRAVLVLSCRGSGRCFEAGFSGLGVCRDASRRGYCF